MDFMVVFKWFVDASVKLYHKISFVVILLFALWAVDNIFGFSSFRYTQAKAETVKKLQEVSSMDSLPSEIKVKLRKEEIEVLSRKSLTEKVNLILSSPTKSISSSDRKNGSWEDLVHFGFALYLFLILFPPLVFLPFAIKDKDLSLKKRFELIGGLSLICLISGSIFTIINLLAHLWVVWLTPIVSIVGVLLLFVIYISVDNIREEKRLWNPKK